MSKRHVTSIPSPLPARGTTLFSEPFNYPDGVITNEFAYYNAGYPGIITNPYWQMDSGSVFARNGAAYTGIPDGIAPDLDSNPNNNSAIFRLTTKRHDFVNIQVAMDLNVKRLVTTPVTPAVAWDGVHIYLRRQDPSNFYVVTVNRRDGVVIIKKKQGGIYTSLTPDGSAAFAFLIPFEAQQQVLAEVKTNADSSVRINGYVNGKLWVSALDVTNPILLGGQTGVRGDNAEFTFDNFTVTAI